MDCLVAGVMLAVNVSGFSLSEAKLRDKCLKTGLKFFFMLLWLILWLNTRKLSFAYYYWLIPIVNSVSTNYKKIGISTENTKLP